MPTPLQTRPPAAASQAEAPAERTPLRAVLGRVSLLVVVALALSTSVRSVEGFSEGDRGGTHARDAVRFLTTTAQQAARRLAQRDQVKPIAIAPELALRLPSGELHGPKAVRVETPRVLSRLRPERLDLPPPGLSA